MQLSEILCILESLAPTRYAEPWDNVGLLVGDPQQAIRKAMLTIDYTAEVAQEAQAEDCDLVIAYHPPIFDALKRITAGSLIFDALRRGLALYSPHTALDVADGGTNDMLADALGLAQRQPLRLSQTKASACRLAVFVPPDAVERVAEALFAAGAGRIGNYSRCSFRSPGTGTFFGEAGANPALGQAGQLERVQEIRLETLLPLDRVDAAVKAMRAAHPYEEPAFDLLQLAAPPEGKGQGRIGTLPTPLDRAQIIARLKRELNLPHLLVAGPTTGPASKLAACAGACGDLINDALNQKADLYLTGEVRHHDALKAAQRGMTVVCCLHSNSERAVLARVAHKLTQALPNLPVLQSRLDRDPFLIQ